MTTGSWRPEEHARLAEIARHLTADDPGFAAGLATLQPREPREYRSRRRRRTAARVVVSVTVCVVVLAMWLWLGWFVATLFTLEAAVMAALMILAGDPDTGASAI